MPITTYDLARAAIGRQATALARTLESAATPAERGYIEALVPRYEATNAAGIHAAETAYARSMSAFAAANPSDLDAQTLAAEGLMDLTPLHMWKKNGAPNRYTVRAVALLEGVLRRDPGHLGANHFLIHAEEDSATPERALAAARHLAAANLPAGAERLAHMPAHIFTRVGDYDGAIAANLNAIAMFRRYVPDEHSNVHNAYYHHDFQVLGYAYMMSGQWAKAKDAADQSAIQAGDNGAAVETYLRFHKWRELLGLPPPQEPGLRWRYARAMAAAATGDLAAARATLQWLDGLHDSDPRTGIARSTLAAAIAVADRHDAAAIAALRHAVALQDGLPLKEPPAWYYPVRETLGARLLIGGDALGAERVFAEDLRRNPNNPRSLFGNAEALAKRSSAGAPRARTQFQRAWRFADVPLRIEDL